MRKDGTRFWAHVILQPIFNEAKEHIGFAKVTTDRTEQKRADDLNTFLMNEVTGYAIFLLDKEGNVDKWSKAAESITGFPEAEIIGKPLHQFYRDTEYADREAIMKQHLAEALENRHEDEDWKVRKDGSFFCGFY